MPSLPRRIVRAAVPEGVRRARFALRHRRLFGDADYAEQFRVVHAKNLWRDSESVSGHGSTVEFTAELRTELGAWLASQRIGSLVDLPCGDFNWMRLVDFPDGMTYRGVDIVPELIQSNTERYAARGLTFSVGDVIAGPVPPAQAYFCRDLFIHFPNDAVAKSLDNIRDQDVEWLVATTFPEVTEKVDTVFPFSRHQNLALFLGEPVALFDDSGQGQQPGKYLGIWRLRETRVS